MVVAAAAIIQFSRLRVRRHFRKLNLIGTIKMKDTLIFHSEGGGGSFTKNLAIASTNDFDSVTAAAAVGEAGAALANEISIKFV